MQNHTDPVERRARPRLEKRSPVEILNMGDDVSVPFYQDMVHGESVDVSEGGLRLRVPYDVREGAEIGILVRREPRLQVFLAKVVWKMREKGSTIYGLRVGKMDADKLP